MADELEEPSSEDAPFDVSVPRECIYRSFEGQPGPCPRCGGSLQQSYQSYMVGTRRGNDLTDSFVMGNDMGWFCTHCPVVVINPSEVSEHLPYDSPKWDIGEKFVVLGIVDLGAVPQDKRELPLGGDDNPIPLVQFTNISGELTRGQSGWSHGRNRKKVAQKRKQRKAKNKRHKRR